MQEDDFMSSRARDMFNKLKAKLGIINHTGFSPRIIIEVGLNASEYSEAKKEAEEMAKVIEIKLSDYLEQFPYNIKVK